MTPKQQRFVQEYLIDLNATQAAIRAGYSARTANREGTRLLSKAVIQEAIGLAKSERSARVQLTQDWVLGRLKSEAQDGKSPSARVRALELLGKHLGLWEAEDTDTDAVLRQVALLRERLTRSPEEFEALWGQHGNGGTPAGERPAVEKSGDRSER